MKPLVIYHYPCVDGFTAAWCFHRCFGDELDFHRGVYGEAPPDVTGRDVYLVDFSYKRPVLQAMLSEVKSLTILDHHKSAAADLDGLQDSRLATVFDMDRSGAMLAWQYLYPVAPPPKLLEHVQDRDLWRFALPGTRDIHADLFSYDYAFDTWDRLMAAEEADLAGMASSGRAIERKHQKDVGELIAVAKRTMLIGGQWVPVVNVPYTMASDAGHYLAELSVNLIGPSGFGATYLDVDTERRFSLRSTDKGADVSLIAQQYGGGGHRNAAGFAVPRDHPLARV